MSEERAAVVQLTRRLTDATPKGQGQQRGPSAAELLVELGIRRYRYVNTPAGVFGVPNDGPPVALPLRGTGPATGGSIRQALARALYTEHGKVASQSALADAVATLEAQALNEPVMPVWVRVAPDPDGNGSWLDLGRQDGQCVHLVPGDWAVSVPGFDGPLWRRGRLVGELPLPERPTWPDGWHDALCELRALVNVSNRTWPLMIGWLIAAILPDLPRPVAYLTGEQGTGKTTAGRMLVRLIDDGPSPLRTEPETPRDLAVTTAAGWVLALDNVSGIPRWLSDALCRIVTGDAYTARELYSDDSVTVLQYQRPVLLTSIDAGALRGDIAERMLPLELEPIPDRQRRTERELWAAYHAARPRILGGLLDLTAHVLAELPAARAALPARPRMADFAELLAAVDRVTGWDALPAYIAGLDGLAQDVIDGSPLATAITTMLDRVGTWQGEPADLLQMLNKIAGVEREHNWPRTAAVLSGQLRRVAPALRARGYRVDGLEGKRKINGRSRRWFVLAAPGAD